MKKILFCVNTYYQLITAIKIVNDFKEDAIIDICVSDHSYHAENIANNCKKIGIFRKVFFVETKELDKVSLLKRMYVALEIALFSDKFLSENFPELMEQYDIVMFHNLGKLENAIYNFMNKVSQFERFEEGYNCYIIQNYIYSNTVKINNIVRFLFGKKILRNNYKSLFLYHPELICYKTNLPIRKISGISETDKELLNEVFNYKDTRQEIREKFIFLGGAPNGNEDVDLWLIKEIQRIVGGDNIVVKPHPRTDKSSYADLGIKVFPVCDAPWELIQMNVDFNDKVFLTVSSSAVLASSLYFKHRVKSIFLYQCVQLKAKDDIYSLDIFLNKLLSNEHNIILRPTSMGELEQICSEE